MKLVVDANVIISALIADSMARELIVTLEPDLSTPAVIHDEIERHHDSIVEKSGMDGDRVEQFLSLLFSYVETVPVEQFHDHIETAETAIGETDPDDVLYLACALGLGAGIWSDDGDFESQDLVPAYTTPAVVDAFETR